MAARAYPNAKKWVPPYFKELASVLTAHMDCSRAHTGTAALEWGRLDRIGQPVSLLQIGNKNFLLCLSYIVSKIVPSYSLLHVGRSVPFYICSSCNPADIHSNKHRRKAFPFFYLYFSVTSFCCQSQHFMLTEAISVGTKQSGVLCASATKKVA